MAQGNQVINGKAFEFAIAKEYRDFFAANHILVTVVQDDAYLKAKECYDSFSVEEQREFSLAARSSIRAMLHLESGFVSPKNAKDVLSIRIARDSEGEAGDVRDVIFSRVVSKWDVGISAKNNHDAVKHSRLSGVLDFGNVWIGHPVSQRYWNAIKPIFDRLQVLKNQEAKWGDLIDKNETVYKPLLDAFKTELLDLCKKYSDAPSKLVKYLIGENPFYKVMKDDNAKMVVIKAFNIDGLLNRTVNGRKPAYSTKTMNLPSRIVEFDYKKDSSTTLNMILDGGWEISFRIHNASSAVEPSLKFDIQLLGVPSGLFTHYVFN